MSQLTLDLFSPIKTLPNKDERFVWYNKDVCWQYDIRVKNMDDDLQLCGLSKNDVSNLRVSDFELRQENKTIIYEEVKNFIHRNEWLGRMSLYPTHFFTARYKGILAGVVIMDMPSAFSKMLGDNTKKLERLISRGACISWSPKNLASSLISFAINWMVKNTPFRDFIKSDSKYVIPSLFFFLTVMVQLSEPNQIILCKLG